MKESVDEKILSWNNLDLSSSDEILGKSIIVQCVSWQHLHCAQSWCRIWPPLPLIDGMLVIQSCFVKMLLFQCFLVQHFRKKTSLGLHDEVQILWEGHKIWKKISHLFWDYVLSNVKQSGNFFQIFVAFPEYLNFTWSCGNLGRCFYFRPILKKVNQSSLPFLIS